MMSATGEASARRDRRGAAFTLVELVVALTVLSILAGLAIPAVTSVQNERVAREPVNALFLLSREVRLRAMEERQPYQIVFTGGGFKAARFFQPYGGAEEFADLQVRLAEQARTQEIIEASQARGISLENTVPDPQREKVAAGLRFFSEYELPEGVDLKLRTWNESDWVDLSTGVFRRWIFQPSGMVEPIQVQVESEGAFFEIEFHPLTGDVTRERSWVE
jgi:prepilin-type N-terminal cleavage/methylation domain-containing protein